MSDFEELADQVLAIDSTKRRADVLIDLKYTKSAEATINRIFDGQFLNGTSRDPSIKEAFIILDSDEEEEDNTPAATTSDFTSTTSPSTPVTKPPPILLQDSSDNDVFKSPNLSPSEDRREKYTSAEFLLDLNDPSFSIDSQPKNATQDDNVSLPSSIYHSTISIDLEEAANNNDDIFSPPSFQQSTFSLDNNSTKRKKTESSPLLDDLFADENDNSTSRKKREPSPSLDDLFADDNDDLFGSEKDDLPAKEKKHDSDSDDIVTLPTMNDFFDELMSQKPETPIYEIEDDDEVVEVDRKGKKKATESAASTPRSWEDEDQPSTGKKRRKQVTDDEKERKKRATEEEKERKKREVEERKRKRAEQAEEKKREKARVAEEKQRLKERKEFEKQRTALFEKANRIRTDRADILEEMIIDVHPDFLKTRAGELIQALFLEKNAEVRDLLLQQTNPKHTISWRRKCKAEWNDDSQTFIPLATAKITKENVVLVHVHTQEFVQYIQDDSVNQFIDRIEQKNPKCQIMLMLEGLDAYYKKKKLNQRRQFDAQIRSSIQGESSSQPKSKRKNDLADISNAPEQPEVEECLNYLQLVRNVMLVPTKDETDTASWIESLTVDLGLSRYKLRNLNNNYKVSKSGTDPQDMYFKMLQEVQLCTPAVAKSIIYSYPTVQSLYQAYKNVPRSEGELLLANLNVERSALHQRDRKINRVMSKKIHSIFTSDDPEHIIY